jgi:protein-tyrosine phosphatase
MRRLRHTPDKLLHARRRQAAQMRVRGRLPRSVLFLCHGNICRSPFAAAAFSRALPHPLADNVEITSAGFILPGRGAPPEAIAAARRVGLELSAHRSAVFTADALRSADLIVVMSDEQAKSVERIVRPDSLGLIVLGDLDPLPITQRTIADPWNGDDTAFDDSYARIERCVGELVRLMLDGV